MKTRMTEFIGRKIVGIEGENGWPVLVLDNGQRLVFGASMSNCLRKNEPDGLCNIDIFGFSCAANTGRHEAKRAVSK